MVCKKAPGKIARHQVLNDIIWCAFNAADVPAIKEGAIRPKQAGRLTSRWAYPHSMARREAPHLGRDSWPHHTQTAATGAGLVADQASNRKSANHAD